ncbi:uncharacterized protein TNCT_261311 [Trichonephila clavata]|uniref:Uncharacterized protein n=1 Tax=Trichonephila clavata TaxID=2740835 RepID=A0A8X6G8J8_TRICU|nr:uncharacterized protein TNCT_261311 [Trichonephila clavata]
MLVSNGVSINTIPEIANTLAETFAKTFSCDDYTPAFQALKHREERVKLNFSSSNEEGYNFPLTLLELRVAPNRSGNTAAGPDGLHYIMLRICPKVLFSPFYYCSIASGKPKFSPHSGVMPTFHRFQSLILAGEQTEHPYFALYRALIRSKLDYGSVIYSSACKSLLKILDPVHHQGLRLCLGAFRTSPRLSPSMLKPMNPH